MNYTEKFNLRKPEESETFDIENFNYNMDVIDPLLVKDTGWIDFYNSGGSGYDIGLDCRKIGAQVTLRGNITITGSSQDTTDHEVTIEAARLTELNLLPQYEFKVDISKGDRKSEVVINENGIYLTGRVGEHSLNNISWLVG